MWWTKKFRKRKLQSLLIFIVVAMCTTLITGSVVILTSLTSVYEGLAEDTGAPDVKVYSRSGFEKDYKSDLLACESVKSVTNLERCSITTIEHDGVETDTFTDVVKYDSSVYGNVRVIDGNMDALSDGKCAIPAALSNDINAEMGDQISILIDGEKLTYEIVAVYAEIYSAATEYTCDLLVNALPKNASATAVCAVWLNNGKDCDDLIEEYTKKNDGILDGYFRSAEDSVVNAELTELILGGILLGISSVVFIAILLILGYIVNNCFHSDKGTIAVYKTLGYREGQIRKIYITFYMSIIGSGALAGALLSPLLSNSFIKDVYKNIGLKGGLNGIWQILVCAFTICAVAFIMLELKTKKLSKMRPVDILNGVDEGRGRKKLKSTKKLKTSFSPAAMAFRMMIRDRKNTILLILTCIVSLYIVNLSVVCLKNIDLIRSETNYYWLGIDKHDITLENRGDEKEFYAICDEIEEDADVKQVVKRNYDMGFAIPYHQTTSALVYESFDNLDMPLIKGRNPKHTDEAVVGNIYLKELGIDVGDYITVQLDSTHRKNLLVVGTYQGFYNMGRGIKLLGGLLDENGVDYEYTQCSITLQSGVDVEHFMDRLNEKYGEKVKVINRKNLYASIMDTVCDPQREALLPFTVITILIGALNAFYIIYASNVEKRKKYTIYKSLGYTSRHLLKMNCIYVGVIVLISIAAAIPAFLILFPKIMVFAMSAFGFAQYKLVVKPVLLIVTNLLMLMVFLGAACLAAVEIYKNHIAGIMEE